MEELKPRKPEEIDVEYFRLCAELGDREFKSRLMMEEEIPQLRAKLAKLAHEMAASKAQYAEVPREKPQG